MLTYYGMFALQHRGQRARVIVTAQRAGQLRSSPARTWGWCRRFFLRRIWNASRATARSAIRYSTTGSSNVTNAQPLCYNTGRGQIAIGHNGNLINAAILRDEPEQRGSIFQTTVDSEIILHLLAQPTDTSGVLGALRRIQGAFSLVMMRQKEIIGVRDPFGFRPLSLGKLEGAYVLSSETLCF